MQASYQYLFGPVPSRRFGRSLGIDLTPLKTCCYDCVFCQLGRTTHKTIHRKSYVDTDKVLDELKHWHATGAKADVVTLSGSGEPTLHSQFGAVLEFIRNEIDIPSVLLTNGALLHMPEVREAAARANIVKVSLSAWHEASFEWLNRPDPHLTFEQVIAGQKAFRDQFKGRLWMEVFLIRGMNSMIEHIEQIAGLAKDIGPDKIQLNTAVRPPAEDFVAPVARNRMAELALCFQPPAEIIADFNSDAADAGQIKANQKNILAMLRRRPCTSRQIAEGYGMHLNEVLKYLGALVRSRRIRTDLTNGSVYYVAVEDSRSDPHDV